MPHFLKDLKTLSVLTASHDFLTHSHTFEIVCFCLFSVCKTHRLIGHTPFFQTFLGEKSASYMPKNTVYLMAVQEVTWDKGGTEGAEEYALYGNGNADRSLRTDYFVCKENVLEVRG